MAIKKKTNTQKIEEILNAVVTLSKEVRADTKTLKLMTKIITIIGILTMGACIIALTI